MTDAPDLDQLARRYLDLWQQQVTAWLNEPDVADAMAKSYMMMIEGIAALAEAAGLTTQAMQKGAGPRDANRGFKTQDEKAAVKDGGRQDARSKDAAVGPTAAATASGDSDRDTRFLTRRIAQLEERIARLESAAASGGRTATRRSRSNRR
jgi:hypothetical protein